MAQLAQLALVAQGGAQGAPGVGLAAAGRAPPPRGPARQLGPQQREQPPQVLALGRGELGEVVVAQHLGAAGPGAQLGAGRRSSSRLAGAVAGVERGEPRRRRWRARR